MRTRLAALFGLVGILLASTQASAEGVSWVTGLVGESFTLPRSMTVDAAGNTYVTGVFTGNAVFGSITMTSAGQQDGFVAKLDRNGDFVWATRMGGSDYDFAGGVALDTAGNVYVTGGFQLAATFGSIHLTSAGSYDVFVEKLDPSGHELWVKREGGSGAEYGTTMSIDAQGNLYVAGGFSAVGIFDGFSLTSAGDVDIFVEKLDSGASVQWVKRMGGAQRDIPNDMELGSAGIFVTGDFQGNSTFGSLMRSSQGAYDAFVMQLDYAGDVQWVQRMGGSYFDYGNGIALDGVGNIYVTGYFQGVGDFGAVQLTATGVEQNDDVYVVKLDPSGSFSWVRQMGGADPDQATAIAADASGNTYVTGMFEGAAAFGTFNLQSRGDANIFVEKLDAGGTVQWAQRMGSTSGFDRGRAIAVNPGGEIRAAGDAGGPGDFGLFQFPGGAYVLSFGPCSTNYTPIQGYGRLLFPPLCAKDASSLSQDVYQTATQTVAVGDHDVFFVSSSPTSLTPLIAEDVLTINGVDAGLGAYARRSNVPPYLFEQAIEGSLVPNPAKDVSTDMPLGVHPLLFELRDVDRTVYGNTAIYLVQSCGISVTGRHPTSFNYVSTGGDLVQFEVRYGLLSQLRASHDFTQSACLDHFTGSPGDASIPTPPPGDAYYFLARGVNTCVAQGFGDSSLMPDPRDLLEAQPTCPCTGCFGP